MAAIIQVPSDFPALMRRWIELNAPGAYPAEDGSPGANALEAEAVFEEEFSRVEAALSKVVPKTAEAALCLLEVAVSQGDMNALAQRIMRNIQCWLASANDDPQNPKGTISLADAADRIFYYS